MTFLAVAIPPTGGLFSLSGLDARCGRQEPLSANSSVSRDARLRTSFAVVRDPVHLGPDKFKRFLDPA
jgi:hypothetical protein